MQGERCYNDPKEVPSLLQLQGLQKGQTSDHDMPSKRSG